ncbi:hypothetical protein [Paraburkholderia sp. GAS334]|uniref:hypothetical protein n=1 Tax=Paraburkholderia sp. GAS334 TaxID=3035131 RepID=UPI003D23AEAA
MTASLSDAGSPVGFLDAGQALTRAGLLVATPVTARESVYREPGLRFSPSSEGLKQMALYRDAPGLTKGVPRFCYGHGVLNKVTRWEDFEPVDGRKSMRVYFTYSVPDAAEWARRSDVQKAFPVVAADMSGTFEPHVIVSLIDGQWKVVNR